MELYIVPPYVTASPSFYSQSSPNLLMSLLPFLDPKHV